MNNLEDTETEINEFEKKSLLALDKKIADGGEENDQALYCLKAYHAYLNFLETKINFKDLFGDADALFYAKLSTDVLAIYACLSHGVKNQSNLIIRSLVESSVMYDFIETDRQNLMSLYLNHAKYLRGKHLKKSDPVDVPTYVNQSTVLAEFDQVKDDYSGMYWFTEYLKKKGYKKTSIIDVFKIVNRQDEYKTLYRSFSNFTHGSSITGHMFQSEQGYTTTANFNKEYIYSMVTITIEMANKTIKNFPVTDDKDIQLISYSKRFLTKLYSIEDDYLE